VRADITSLEYASRQGDLFFVPDLLLDSVIIASVSEAYAASILMVDFLGLSKERRVRT
jgi:hypothetical protein